MRDSQAERCSYDGDVQYLGERAVSKRRSLDRFAIPSARFPGVQVRRPRKDVFSVQKWRSFEDGVERGPKQCVAFFDWKQYYVVS